MPFPDAPVLLTVILIANRPICTRLMRICFGNPNGFAQALGYSSPTGGHCACTVSGKTSGPTSASPPCCTTAGTAT